MSDTIPEMRSLAEKIRAMTEAVRLTGQPNLAEPEVDAYTQLVTRRQPFIDALTQLTQQAPPAPDSPEWQDVKKIIEDIMVLDKEHRRVMEYLQGKVKTSMKDVRSGKKVNNAYAHFMRGGSSGLLDTKQ